MLWLDDWKQLLSMSGIHHTTVDQYMRGTFRKPTALAHYGVSSKKSLAIATLGGLSCPTRGFVQAKHPPPIGRFPAYRRAIGMVYILPFLGTRPT
jgi:hypothetical protein